MELVATVAMASMKSDPDRHVLSLWYVFIKNGLEMPIPKWRYIIPPPFLYDGDFFSDYNHCNGFSV